MKKSDDPKVQKFLDEVQCFDIEKFNILQKSREIVFAEDAKTMERIMYGGIMFSRKKDFGGVFVSKNHVSFEFTQGVFFSDLKKNLEGLGRFRRHLKLKSVADISEKDVEFFVKQAFKVLDS